MSARTFSRNGATLAKAEIEGLERRIAFDGNIDLTGYTQTFNDDFNSLSISTSSPKGAATWYAGYPPNGSKGIYGYAVNDSSALSVSNGVLSNKLKLKTGVISTGSFAGGLVGMKNSAGTAMVTLQTPGATKTTQSGWQWYGWIGTKFTVGASPVTISQLGRYTLSGNTRSHQVRLFNASTGADVAQVSVNLNGQTGFVYANIAAGPVTLAANTSYFLLTDNYEPEGVNVYDNFLDGTTSVTASGGITINDSRWGAWSSGKLFSADSTAAGFSQKYGYFSMRARMPSSGTGAWPSFWLKGTADITKSGDYEEADIFEWYGNTYSNNQAETQQASHNWHQIPGSEQQDYTSPSLYSPHTPIPGGAFPWQDYHTYGFKSDPQNLTWYIDGVQTNQIATPTNYMTSPFFMVIEYNTARGFTDWPLTGLVANSSLDIDWVRVYSLPTTPTAPTGLSATPASSSQINVSWTDASSNETGFKIERATNSTFTQNLTLVTTTAANVTSYSNTGLTAGTTYYYRVRATTASGDSANSNTASAIPTAGTSVLLSQGKTATASSVDNASRPASNAFDGNTTTTRWASAYTNNEWLQVDLGKTHQINRITLNWEAAYASSFKLQASDNGTTWTDLYSTTTGTGGTQDLTTLSGAGRYVRMLGIQRATIYGYSLFEMQVYGVPALLSQGKTATASSSDNASLRPASAAFDGNTTSTRWSSAYTNNEWLQVDLGATYQISQVKLTWEAAYASSFKIQTSIDGVNWTDLHSTTTGTGGVQDLTGLTGTGRYVRMLGIQRATQYGYSLWEMQVYGY